MKFQRIFDRITACKEVHIYYPRFLAFTPSNEHIEQWKSYMKDKYDININLSYTPKLLDAPADTTVYVWKDEDGNFDTSQGVDIETLVELSGTNGFVYVESYEMLNTLIQSDLIMSVDSFIASILTLINLTPDVLDQFSDSSGNIWAIPLASKGAIRSKQTYNKAWLDKAGITVPKSIEEFLILQNSLHLKNPDGNDKKDSYIMEYSNSSLYNSSMKRNTYYNL